MNAAHDALNLRGKLFELEEVGADNLHRIGTFYAGKPLLDVVLNILREVHVDADEFLGKLVLKIFDEIFLQPSGRPLLERLQGHEELGVEEASGVAAIIGPSVLRDHGDYF